MRRVGNSIIKFIDSLEDFFAKKIVNILQAVICGVFPLIFFTFFSIDGFHDGLINKYEWLKKLDNHVLGIIVICLILNALPAVVSPLISTFSTKSKSFVGIEGLMALIKAFESVVTAKYKRFELAHKSFLTKSDKNAESIFFEITKPDQQIAILVETLHLLTKEVARQQIKGIQDGQIKVRLIQVQDNKLIDYVHWAPENFDPYTPVSKLQETESTAFLCLKNKRMILIQDVEKELTQNKRKYVPTHEGAADEFDIDKGSLVCYPVYFDNHVEFVLCISSNIPYFFRDHLKSIYKFVLDQFSARMKIEIALIKLKKMI